MVSARFLRFCLVGLSGVLVNEGLLWLLTEKFAIYYLFSALIAIEVSIFNNYLLNEFWTFRDRRQKASLKRFPRFNLVSMGGLIINLSVLFILTQAGLYYLTSNLFGIACATFWNYWINLNWTWKLAKRPKLENPFLSIVIPTYNEKENIPELLSRIYRSLKGRQFEVIVVDDNSPDGTAEMVRKLKRKYRNLRLVCRKGKLGLSSAVLAGFEKTKGNVLAVMDADLSHPPEKLPQLLSTVQNGWDVAVGSRYIAGGSCGEWSWKRRLISWGATLLAKPLTSIKDPMSGFFCIRKESLPDNLNPKGFKILLEILAKADLKVKEIPYKFENRRYGESKLNQQEILNYLYHCLSLYKNKFKLK